MSNAQFTILIAEDEGLVALDLAARLQQAGYLIAGIADNYEEAISIFKKTNLAKKVFHLSRLMDIFGRFWSRILTLRLSNFAPSR